MSKYRLTRKRHTRTFVDTNGSLLRQDVFVKGDIIEPTPEELAAFSDRFEPLYEAPPAESPVAKALKEEIKQAVSTVSEEPPEEEVSPPSDGDEVSESKLAKMSISRIQKLLDDGAVTPEFAYKVEKENQRRVSLLTDLHKRMKS